MDKRYSLKELYKAGMISYKATFYIDLAEKKESLRQTGMNGKEAESKLANDMKISARTVRRADEAKKRLEKALD